MTGNDIGGKAVEPESRWRRWLVRYIVLTLAIFILAALLYPFFARERDGYPRPHTQCLANVKNLAIAVNMYVTDYDGPPDPRRWGDQISEYVRSREIHKCPEAPGLVCGYALNVGVEGATARDMSGPGGKTVVIFESSVGWNAHGGRELLPAKPRHRGGDNYGFLEGSARWVKRGAAEGLLRWEVGGGK